MSSADPIEVGSPTPASGDVVRSSRPSGKRPAKSSDPALQKDADLRAEKPQTNPEPDSEARKTDRKPPETDPAPPQGPAGIKGAFRKHPVAMIVCLGLIVVGIIAGILWYLQARHYESTDDAFIDGRPVSISPEVMADRQRQGNRQSDRPRRRSPGHDRPRNYRGRGEQADAQVRRPKRRRKTSSADRGPAGQVAGHRAGDEARRPSNSRRIENRAPAAGAKGAARSSTRSRPRPTSTARRPPSMPPTSQVAAERQIDVLKAEKIGADAQLDQRRHKRTAEANL